MTTQDNNHPPVPARSQKLSDVCQVLQIVLDAAGLVLAWWIHTSP